MKTTTRLLAWAALALTVLLLATTQAIAAEPAAAAAPQNGTGLVDLLTPLIAGVVTFAAKHLAKLPGWTLVLVAAIAGGLYEIVTALVAGQPPNTLQGLLYGGAAVALHQFKVQLTKPKPIPEG